MRDKFIGILAVSVVIGFLFVLIPFVAHIDLAIILAIVVVMMVYDFYLMLFKGKV